MFTLQVELADIHHITSQGILMFDLNEKVIYPGHGVAVIGDIVEKQVGSNVIRFFKLVFVFKDITFLVPVNNVQVIGLRYPSDSDTLQKAKQELVKKPERKLESIDFTPSGWTKRHKDYQLKIQSGLLVEIAKIYRDLMYIAQQKDLSFGERQLLVTIEDLFAQELQIIKNIDRELVVQEIRNPFKQLVFQDKNYFAQTSAIT